MSGRPSSCGGFELVVDTDTEPGAGVGAGTGDEVAGAELGSSVVGGLGGGVVVFCVAVTIDQGGGIDASEQ